MLKCQQATRLLSEQQERPLSVAEKCSLALHVSICRACRTFGRQLPQMRQIMQSYKAQLDDKDQQP